MIVVVGLSHRTAPVDVREKLAAGADALPAVLARARRPHRAHRGPLPVDVQSRRGLRARPLLAGDDGVDAALRAIREELARHGGARSGDDLAPLSLRQARRRGREHVFRVAASLDSMVLGEPQILGQVKEAYEAAVAAGALKGMLGRCVTRAFAVAKRVRTETAIGAGTVSISSVAVDLAGASSAASPTTPCSCSARARWPRPRREASARARARCASATGASTAPPPSRATCNAAAVPWDGLDSELVHADVVVASTASRRSSSPATWSGAR